MREQAVLYLFDIDGTLIRAGGAGTKALDIVFERRYGVSDAMHGINAGGKTDPAIVTEIFEARLGRVPEPGEIDEILDEYVPILRDTLPDSVGFRILPAVFETLDYLAAQAGVHLAVATGNIRSGAQVKLERGGLWERFAVGGFGDDSAHRPTLVERAIERGCAYAGFEFLRERVVVVGDTPYDVHAARECGVRVMAVATGMATRTALESCDPDVVLDTLEELPDWHRAWFNE